MNRAILLSELIRDLDITLLTGSPAVTIQGLSIDSRSCCSGSLFFALKGEQFDGHDFAGQAVQRGSAAVVVSQTPDEYAPGVTYLQTAHPRRMLSKISSRFYDYPSRSIGVIGVTGTDGKSSTCDYIYQILNRNGRMCALISSVWTDDGSGKTINSRHITTPDAVTVQDFLRKAVDNGCCWAVIESSSHGLSASLARLSDITFRIGVCTGITSEHLDFHGTRAAYIDAKMNLFRQLDPAGSAAILPDEGDWLVQACQVLEQSGASTGDAIKAYIWSVPSGSIDSAIDCFEESAVSPFWKSPIPPAHFTAFRMISGSADPVETGNRIVSIAAGDELYDVEVPLLFPQQIRNFAAALSASLAAVQLSRLAAAAGPTNLQSNPETLLASAAPLRQLLESLEECEAEVHTNAAPITISAQEKRKVQPLSLKVKDELSRGAGKVRIRLDPIPGRFQLFSTKSHGLIMIDFAHTPDAFGLLFSALRALFPICELTALFGSAGERDRTKRPALARAAASYCGTICLTEEDPRMEDPLSIVDDIVKGIPTGYHGKLMMIPDREEAVRRVLGMAGHATITCLLGKGHERSIDRGTAVMPWNELEIVKKLLQEKGDAPSVRF